MKVQPLSVLSTGHLAIYNDIDREIDEGLKEFTHVSQKLAWRVRHIKYEQLFFRYSYKWPGSNTAPGHL